MQEWRLQAHLDYVWVFCLAYAWKYFQRKYVELKAFECQSLNYHILRTSAAVVTGTGGGAALTCCWALGGWCWAGCHLPPLCGHKAHMENWSLFSSCPCERQCSKDGRSRNEQFKASVALCGFCSFDARCARISLFLRLLHDTVKLSKKNTKKTNLWGIQMSFCLPSSLWITGVLSVPSGSELWQEAGEPGSLLFPWVKTSVFSGFLVKKWKKGRGRIYETSKYGSTCT